MENDSKNKKRVYVAHCVDAEGPLHESIEATFDRLNSLLGIKLEPSKNTLEKIQNKQLDLNGKEEFASEIFSHHLTSYNDSWQKIDEMLNKIMNSKFRNSLPDSLGNGWIFNWYCVDHVGYNSNPRNRTLGHHKIFDHYSKMIEKTESKEDEIHWHFHPMSIYREAHRKGTSFFNSFLLHDVLCRKIIERYRFPNVFHAGFHVERPDIHLFLEQWIPFDISNISITENNSEKIQSDLQDGRFGDWRFAPDDWSIYNPSHDNYQFEGSCKRYIGRILNLKTRHANISQNEVDKAFSRANQGLPTLLGVTNHDFRNMESEIIPFYDMLKRAKEKYPEVEFVYSEVANAFRTVIFDKKEDFGNFSLSMSFEKTNESLKLNVSVQEGSIFGPQPYLAIKTKSNEFIHENFDLIVPEKSWSYTFDIESIKPEDIAIVGVASNDKFGHTFIKTIDFRTHQTIK